MEEDLNRTRRTSTTVLTTDRQAGRQTQAAKKKKTWKGFSCWHRPAEDSYLGGVGVTEQDAVAVAGRERQGHLGLEGGGLRAINRSPFYPVLLQGRAPLWQGLHQLPGALGTHTQTDTAKAGVSSVQS